MKKDYLVFCIVWLALGAVSLWVFSADGMVKLIDGADSKLAALAGTFSALALIVERFVGIFVREETNTILAESRVKKSSMDMINRAEMVTSLASVPQEDKANVQASVRDLRFRVSDAETKMDVAERTRSPKFQRISILAGVVVAAFGFRFFGEIAEVVNAKPIAMSIFYIADVGLSGILIGGGSSIIDDVIMNLRKSS